MNRKPGPLISGTAIVSSEWSVVISSLLTFIFTSYSPLTINNYLFQYHSPVYWFPVKVPSTVLTGLVANHIYPDPYQGLNNMLIPDASDQFNKEYNLEQYSHLPNDPNPWKKPYWYRTTFKVPAADKGRRFQLIFKGINYRAAVWLNGKQIADSTQMAGMFAEHNLDVSNAVKAGG
jgi:beta-galactosidase/beta-glucuronidase